MSEVRTFLMYHVLNAILSVYVVMHSDARNNMRLLFSF